MTTTYALRVGDRVFAEGDKYRGAGTIEKVNPRTILVLLDTGVRVKFDPFFLRPLAEGEAPPPAVIPEDFVVGEVVMLSRPDPRMAGHFVVIGHLGADRSKIAKLGGDAGRYWKVPTRTLARVPVSALGL